MKKVFNFILTSLCVGLAFSIPMALIIVCTTSYIDIYMFLYLLVFGPTVTSFGVIWALFNKKAAFKNSKNIKWNEFIESKPVIVLSIFCFILCSIYILYGLIYTASRHLTFHYIETKQYNKVIKISKLLNKIYPQNCIIYTNWSYANFMIQNYDEAIHYDKQHLLCNPYYYLAYIDIAAAIYLDNKDNLDNKYKNILEELDKSLNINKDSFITHFKKQDIHFMMNDCKNGIKDVENILKIIDKKGAEKYKYVHKRLIIEEALPSDWRQKVLEELSACPDSKEKEELIKKLKSKVVSDKVSK